MKIEATFLKKKIYIYEALAVKKRYLINALL